jgi:hypothetical protein
MKNALRWMLMQDKKLIYFTVYYNVDGEET